MVDSVASIESMDKEFDNVELIQHSTSRNETSKQMKIFHCVTERVVTLISVLIVFASISMVVIYQYYVSGFILEYPKMRILNVNQTRFSSGNFSSLSLYIYDPVNRIYNGVAESDEKLYWIASDNGIFFNQITEMRLSNHTDVTNGMVISGVDLNYLFYIVRNRTNPISQSLFLQYSVGYIQWRNPRMIIDSISQGIPFVQEDGQKFLVVSNEIGILLYSLNTLFQPDVKSTILLEANDGMVYNIINSIILPNGGPRVIFYTSRSWYNELLIGYIAVDANSPILVKYHERFAIRDLPLDWVHCPHFRITNVILIDPTTILIYYNACNLVSQTATLHVTYIK